MEKLDLRKMFGAEVKRRRTDLGISQEELAERANLHRTYVSDVEAGKRNPSLASIQRLASALGAPLSAVFCSAEKDSAMARSPLERGMAERIVSILLVEEDPKAAQLTVALFKKFKLTNCLKVIADGGEALDFIFSHGAYAKRGMKNLPQVVLLDLELSKVQGLEVLRQLKADPRTRMIPVVVLTPLRKDPRCREASRLGAEDCLVKPLDFQSFSLIMPKLSFAWTLLKSEVQPSL
jgi:CheY-like chemotaxis protein/DNA-binding XRE family transcriptional regulator